MSDASQTKRRSSAIQRIFLGFALLLGGGLLSSCQNTGRGGGNSPTSTSDPALYRDVVSDFHTGTIALIVDDKDHAERFLKRATELAPQEPAPWANLGLLYLRKKQRDMAASYLNQAQSLAPNSSEIEALLGHLENEKGNVPEAIAHFRKAVQLDPANLHAHYTLAKLIERQQDPNSDTDYQQQMEAILKAQPDNLTGLLELAQIAMKRKDTAAFKQALKGLNDQSASWPPDVRERMEKLNAAAASPDLSGANISLMETTNLLHRQHEFHRSQRTLVPDVEAVGFPLENFLVLPKSVATPALPDTDFTFEAKTIAGAENGKDTLALDVSLMPEITPPLAQSFRMKPMFEGERSLILADGHTVRIITDGKTVTLPFPGGAAAVSPSQDGILPVDLNYDFHFGLALAGEGGLKLYRLDTSGIFQDVTARTALPPAILNVPYYGVWAADWDLDGDLDLVLGSKTGGTLVLRNNGDGTFKPQNTFQSIKDLRGFLWADIDGDGAPDAALLDAQGQVSVFMNQRTSRFLTRPLPQNVGKVAAFGTGDVDRDGLLDFVLLQTDGSLLRLSDKSGGRTWETVEMARWQGFSAPATVGSARLFVADMDNNGGLDLIASTPQGGQLWLCDEKGAFQPFPNAPAAGIAQVADLNGDGRFDFLTLSADGKPVQQNIKPGSNAKNYQWTEVRPRATLVARGNGGTSGDQRINSFGIGGEVEMRSGLLVQKQVITGPSVHFGMGTNPDADYTRFVWPNGLIQGEFSLKSAQQVLVIQRLKGSCPWLFAWDGKKMSFVTDFIWRSPLGLRINAQDTAGVMTTEDWVKLRGDQLAPRDGMYDLRITAELWETHFFDLVSLMVVDHPIGSEIYVDERFAFPPPKLQVFATDPPHPILRALDDNGKDVTDTVKERDGKYLDTFGRGQYQGVTRDHYVEVQIPRDTAQNGNVTLLANGWIHPTDSSLNVAMAQGNHPKPQGLQLQIPDDRGGWVTVKPNLGFPSGKTKTILIDLSDVLPKMPAHDSVARFRLRTNLEIYWDCLQWTVLRPNTPLKTQRIGLKTADLRSRGISVTTQADPSSPELPDYDKIQTRTQSWRDLIGYYTRFGDVRELLEKVDDRYVIMNAGDELALQFVAPPAPPSGWVRDFVLIGDGWEKDGDYNTAFSKTVLPLPSHSRPNYDVPPGRLEEDPVYRAHPHDWEVYHTRYITPEAFQNAIRPRLQH